MTEEAISLLYPQTDIFGNKLMRTLSEELTFTPKGFLTFQFDIPFQLPINDGQFIFSKKNQIALLYKQKELDVNENQISYFSQIEIVSVLLEDLGEFPSVRKHNEYFEKAFGYLNTVIQSIMIRYYYPEVRTLSLEDIPAVFLSFYSRKSKIRKEDFTPRIFIANPEDSRFLKPEPIPTDSLSNLVDLADSINDDKFVDALLYHRRAQYDFKHGRYQEAVIKANTFVEMSMYKFLTFIKKDSGETDQKIANILRCGYENILKDHLKPFFESNGQVFDRTDASCKLYDYYNNTYLVRNKIVHEGQHFSFEESSKALTSATDIVKECVSTFQANPIDTNIFDFSYLIVN